MKLQLTHLPRLALTATGVGPQQGNEEPSDVDERPASPVPHYAAKGEHPRQEWAFSRWVLASSLRGYWTEVFVDEFGGSSSLSVDHCGVGWNCGDLEVCEAKKTLVMPMFRQRDNVRNLIRLHPTIDDKGLPTRFTPYRRRPPSFLSRILEHPSSAFADIDATQRGSREGTPPQSTEDATRRGSLEGTVPQSTEDATRRDSYCSYGFRVPESRLVRRRQ
jgi:hypothetical protein